MGAGMSIGQRLVGGIFGPPSVEVRAAQTPAHTEPCAVYRTDLDACLRQATPHDSCESRIALYKECLEKRQ